MRFDPLYWLDLRDAKGRPDHQKIIPLVVIIAAIVFHAVHNPFAWWELVVLGAIAFGPRMYGLFLRRSSFGFGELTESRAESRVYALQEMLPSRLDDERIDVAPELHR